LKTDSSPAEAADQTHAALSKHRNGWPRSQLRPLPSPLIKSWFPKPTSTRAVTLVTTASDDRGWIVGSCVDLHPGPDCPNVRAGPRERPETRSARHCSSLASKSVVCRDRLVLLAVFMRGQVSICDHPNRARASDQPGHGYKWVTKKTPVPGRPGNFLVD
jgi:hypothetical protein